MSNTIQINELFKTDCDVFMIVRKANPSFYQLHKSYSVLDCKNDYVSRYFIHSIIEIKLHDINKEISLLDKNTTLDIYKQILTGTYGIKENDILYKMVFSKNRPLINYD